MKIGYARVSTLEQNTNLQLDALKRAGCKKIFTDEGMSGESITRPKLNKALKALNTGDVLTVWKLDRLGISLPHLIKIVNDLEKRGIGLKSLSEQIDTSTAGGKQVFHVFGALAEFERSLIKERTLAGLMAAKRRGVRLGRKHKLTDAQVQHGRKLMNSDVDPQAVAKTLRVSRATLYRALKRVEA